jgi:ABC-2 type transport system ATP-binding protein
MLQIVNYQKAYGSNPVLIVPHLELSHGIYWLKGENGAGKTTFLKSVAGIIPFEGEINVTEISIRKQRMLYTKIVSFAEAEPVYPSFLSGNDLIDFFSKTKGRNEMAERSIISDFGMQSYLPQKISTYSSGMLKKLSLLLGFAGNPKLILLDEPFITLDVDAVSMLEKLIVTSFKKGTSILVSSHQQLEINTAYTTLAIQHKTIQQETNVAAVK